MPPKVWRTTTFRLTALFAGLFIGGVALLIGLVYLETFNFMSDRANGILAMESEPFRHTHPETIRALLGDAMARDPLTEFSLFSPDGEKLAGLGTVRPSDMPVLDGMPQDFPGRDGQPPQRAVGQRLPWGDVLIIQRDTRQLMELRGVMLSALLWSGGLIIVLGATLAVALSIRPLRRIQAMQRASNAIVAGRMDIRLPLAGKGDELDHLASIVNVMMDEIERVMGEARTVGESVAHGLRTPLTRIRAMLDHAYDLDRQDDRGQLIERCITETDNLLARFRALLRIADVEARNRRQGIAPMSLSDVVEQVGELYLPVAFARDIRFTISSPPGIEARADAELMFEALSNLVDNALKFTPPGGQVQLTLGRSDTGAVVQVRDTGPGVPPEERALVVKRFYRSQSLSDVSGHGLGLALVSAVAALHGFELSIEEGEPGALFRLSCPAP